MKPLISENGMEMRSGEVQILFLISEIKYIHMFDMC
jgi:hypothetical protein